MSVVRPWLAGTAIGLGLVAAGLAVASATVWRPPDHVSATHKAGPYIQAVVAEPGVMEAQARTVEIAVKSTQPVVVAIGRDTDVTAWLADSPAEHLTGFANRHTFTVRESGSNEPLAAAVGSDLWVVAREYSSGGLIKWEKAEEGRWSLVIAPAGAGGEGAAVSLEEAEITMTWPQVVSTPLLWPGVAVGILLVVVGGLGLVVKRGRVGAEDRFGYATGELAPDLGPVREASPVAAVPQLAAVGAGGAPPLGTGLSDDASAREVGAGPAEPAETADPADHGEAAEPAPPAKPKRRWFRRRPLAPVEEPPPEEPPPAAPEPKLDLGLATPNRNWERLAAPDPRYADLDESEAEPEFARADAGAAGPLAEAGVDAAGEEVWPPRTRGARPRGWPEPEPSLEQSAGRPSAFAGFQAVDSPAFGATQPPGAIGPLPSLADLPEESGRYEPTPAPSRYGLPQRGAGAPPQPATPAQKIEALRQTHTPVADEAAETIAAAMAAAAGAGSAAGLTRRQIREAERAAAEALHVAGRSTGEIPVWQSSANSSRLSVQMQSSEGGEQ
ncbi:MAG: hypothetical protein LBC97_14505 [Bifidobacteriaceae bacterium]|jgi:hypothetical protein|nr:hypothetical protein [Bifidobacteriaceae bacterium]